MNQGWHFTSSDVLANGDGRPIVIGEWLDWPAPKPLVLCESGLHLSERAIDALAYAPGTIAWRVEGDGEMVRGDDKIVCRRRRAVARVDATRLLLRFARADALDVAHLWSPPPAVVRRFLLTGAEARGAAAGAAARAAGAAQNNRLTDWLLRTIAGESLPDRISPEEIAEPAREVVRAWEEAR